MSTKSEIQFNIWTALAEIMAPDGSVSLKDLDNLPAVAYNAGKKCDILEGPCSCGGWHDLTEERNFTFYGQELIKQFIGDK